MLTLCLCLTYAQHDVDIMFDTIVHHAMRDTPGWESGRDIDLPARRGRWVRLWCLNYSSLGNIVGVQCQAQWLGSVVPSIALPWSTLLLYAL